MDPAIAVEMHGVEPFEELHLVLELADIPPETHTGLMPGRRKDRVLTLGTVDREEVERLMVGVVQTDGHDDMTEAQVQGAAEGLLQPELFELHLTAFLRLALPFAAFLVFALIGRAGAAMLKLNLRAQLPAFAEVVAQIDHGMGNVETTIALVVLVFGRLRVAIDIVTIKVTAVSHFTVPTDTEPMTAGMAHHRVGGIDLSLNALKTAKGKGC